MRRSRNFGQWVGGGWEEGEGGGAKNSPDKLIFDSY